MTYTLATAGLCNLLFGIWAVAWPHLWFEWCHLEGPRHPVFWQCIGMVSGVYGLGCLIAATNPIHHWVIILVGFIGKILNPIGFAWAAFSGVISWSGAWAVLLIDVLWLIPFAMILWTILQAHIGRPPTRENPYTIQEAASRYTLSNGQTLEEAGKEHTLVLVFLRHFGCAFTLKILHGLQSLETDAKRHDAKLVLVHMMHHGEEDKYLPSDEHILRIADPYCELYRAFGLGKGGFWELLGPLVWIKGFLALLHAFALVRSCGIGKFAGDGLQMPGAFLYRDGTVLSAQPAHSAADLPDVEGLFHALKA